MRISKDTQKRKLTCGSLKLNKIVTPSGTYWMGTYTHPLGLVVVYTESKFTHITAWHAGAIYTRTRTDHPTTGQISHYCRKLLLELSQSENKK